MVHSVGLDTGIMTLIDQYNFIQSSFTALKILCVLLFLSLAPSPGHNWSFCYLYRFAFSRKSCFWITQLYRFSNWFFFHFHYAFKVPSCLLSIEGQGLSFKLISSRHWIIFYCLDEWLFIHLPTEGYLQFSCSVVSDSLQPHESQHTRPPCPSPTPGVHSDSRPSSQWCHPAISSSVIPLLLVPSIFPSIRDFSNESALPIRWPKYRSFSFSISPSNEYSGLISFRMDWLDLQPKGLSRVFSNTTVQKHQFFSA